MLLKITEKIIRRNVFEQKENEIPTYTLASVSTNYLRLKRAIRYHKPSKPIRNKTQFKQRIRCTQSLRSKLYAIIMFIYRKNHPLSPLNCYLCA